MNSKRTHQAKALKAAPKLTRAPASRKRNNHGKPESAAEFAPTSAKGTRTRIRGARTRRRIMNATLSLLAEQPYAAVRITEIARTAHIAQPNFYAYFSSVEDVVYAIAEELNADELAVFLQPSWHGEHGLALAKGLVEAALKVWQRHHSIFSIVGFLADKHPGRFTVLRQQQTRMICKAFESKVHAAQQAGRLSPSVQARLASYQCFGMLATTSLQYDLWLRSGFSHQELVETTARLLLTALGTEQ
jgi:AcrR family transcriptional regulator